MDAIADTTMRSVEFAITAAARRQDVFAHNIANASVPNYRAKAVDFEGALREALSSGSLDSGESVTATVRDAGGLPNYQGNTVKLEGEMVGLLKNNMIHDAMVQSYNFKMNMTRTAIGKR